MKNEDRQRKENNLKKYLKPCLQENFNKKFKDYFKVQENSIKKKRKELLSRARSVEKAITGNKHLKEHNSKKRTSQLKRAKSVDKAPKFQKKKDEIQRLINRKQLQNKN